MESTLYVNAWTRRKNGEWQDSFEQLYVGKSWFMVLWHVMKANRYSDFITIEWRKYGQSKKTGME